MLGIVIGVLVLTALIVIHEMGHFIVARRNGVEVEEFGVGFPPKVVGRTLGKGIMKCYYTINALPLGGFVKLKGENSEDTRPGSFGAASLWAKTKITVAGIAMNFVAAALLLSLAAAIKMPVLFENQFTVPADTQIVTQRVDVVAVGDDSPAQQQDFKVGDQLRSVAGQSLITAEEASTVLEQHAGEEVVVELYRPADEEALTKQVDLRESDDEGYLGVALQQYEERRSTWSAPVVGVVLTAQFSWETLQVLGDAVGGLFVGDTETASAAVTGPVGIFYIFSQITSLSLLLVIAGVVSLSLAVINLLPIPALDGGRLAVTAIFEALNKPLTEKTENAIHGTGMVFLLLLIIIVTVLDVSRFFG